MLASPSAQEKQYFLEIYLDKLHYRDVEAKRSPSRAMARSVATSPEEALQRYMRLHKLSEVFYARVHEVECDKETFQHYHLYHLPVSHNDRQEGAAYAGTR
jgi:hypothetical protein